MIFETSGNKEVNNSDFFKNNNTQDYSRKIVLANKGEMGYIPGIDLDNNGIITLDEFNKYCEENELSQDDKLKLMSVMQAAKTSQALSDDKEEEDKRIYARKGDKKYVEKMDENKDSKVTYEEYMKYCAKYASENKETQKEPQDGQLREAIRAYSQKEETDADIKIDSEV